MKTVSKSKAEEKANAKGVKVKSSLKAGGIRLNHNETLVRDRRAKSTPKGVKVKSSLKAGGIRLNHNETLVRDTSS